MPDPDQHRIAKLLARAGVASRREVERMITEGRVARNGVVLDTPATVLPSLHGVTVDGQPVEAPAPARLFLYHKPPGLLVTERDPGGRPTIYDRLPKELPRVVPVGRLDLATEGLLLLTTDGGLKRQLELPATGVERAYRARAYGAVTQAQLEELIEGVEIEGVRYGSIDANLERRTGANVWIELILTEGKNREVRRVLEYLGLRVSRLIRTRYGPFVLGDLPPGEVGEVRRHDVESFRKHPTRLDLPQPARVQGGAIVPVARVAKPAATPTPTAAPKPLHHRPKKADGPPRQTSLGRTKDPRSGNAFPAKSRGGANRPGRSSSPPQAVLGEGDRRAKPGGGGASARGRSAEPRVRTQPADRKPDAKPTRKQGTQPAPVANPARAARARAHRDATGRADPASSPKPGSRPKRPGPPRPPRTRK